MYITLVYQRTGGGGHVVPRVLRPSGERVPRCHPLRREALVVIAHATHHEVPQFGVLSGRDLGLESVGAESEVGLQRLISPEFLTFK